VQNGEPKKQTIVMGTYLNTPSKPIVIIPTYNEAENIGPLTSEIWQHAPGMHVCFVDDNSQDGTQQKIEEARKSAQGHVHVISRAGKLGLGTAYIAGFRWALAQGYDAIIEMDADLSHSPSDLPRIVKLLGQYDVVVGSRYIEGGGTANWGLSRKIISRLGSLYGRIALGLRIRDLTGGFNGWRAKVLQVIDVEQVRSEGYSFQIELKYRAVTAGFNVAEMPIIFTERRAGQSKMSGGIVLEAMYRVWQLRLLRGQFPRLTATPSQKTIL